MHDIVIAGLPVGLSALRDPIGALSPRSTLLHHAQSAIRLEGVDASADDMASLRAAADAAGADCFVVPEGCSTERFRLFCFDMDSTLIENECINEMARAAGVFDEISRVTDEAMAGRLHFTERLRRRVALLAGAPISILGQAERAIRIMPGAEAVANFARRHGVSVYVISGGFSFLTRPLATRLGLSGAVSNELVLRDGRLTGEVTGPAGREIVDAVGKRRAAQILAHLLGLNLDNALCCGDGSNDIEMVTAAGLDVSFHGRAKLEAVANVRIRHNDLSAIPLLFRESWTTSRPL